MAQVFDTDKVRNAARKVRRLSERLDGEVTDTVRHAGIYVEAIRGETAEAIDERLNELRSELLRSVDALEEISVRLRAYANAIEAADERAADIMRQGG